MAYKLLLADDSITIQKVVELVLAEEDFQIKSVSNGEDALNLLETFRPDIVLADIEMPKVNGYNLCDKIKKNPSTSHMPVILLAGAFEPIDEELARQVMADDTIVKPFESQELISKINAALAMVSAETVGGINSAEEEVLEAVAEEDMFAEAVGVEAVEAVEAESTEEDLWSMEDISEAAEGPVEIAVSEEQGLNEPFEVIEEKTAPAAPEFEQEPVREEQIVRPAARGPVIAEADMPTKDDFLRLFETVVNKKVEALLSEFDIREALLSALMPSMKDAVEKVLWEVAPELAEKVLKEILKSSVSSLTREVEKVIWETVPDLANTMISREIEKIKSEF
jgi:DNA-binding response OmpR family regulator